MRGSVYGERPSGPRASSRPAARAPTLLLLEAGQCRPLPAAHRGAHGQNVSYGIAFGGKSGRRADQSHGTRRGCARAMGLGRGSWTDPSRTGRGAQARAVSDMDRSRQRVPAVGGAVGRGPWASPCGPDAGRCQNRAAVKMAARPRRSRRRGAGIYAGIGRFVRLRHCQCSDRREQCHDRQFGRCARRPSLEHEGAGRLHFTRWGCELVQRVEEATSRAGGWVDVLSIVGGDARRRVGVWAWE